MLALLVPSLTVYSDPKVEATGHAWVKLQEDPETHFSVGLQVHGIVDESESETPETLSYTYTITEEQVERVKEVFDMPGDWNYERNNCVDFVCQALDVCEIPHPSFKQWDISHPRLLHGWISAQKTPQPLPIAPLD